MFLVIEEDDTFLLINLVGLEKTEGRKTNQRFLNYIFNLPFQNPIR
jgi:hypothetical protein